MTTDDKLKLAADTIRAIRDELEELQMVKSAQETAIELYENGRFPAERAIQFMQEYSEGSSEELEIVKKAMELQSQESFSFGTLSDRIQDVGSLDNFTRWLIED